MRKREFGIFVGCVKKTVRLITEHNAIFTIVVLWRLLLENWSALSVGVCVCDAWLTFWTVFVSFVRYSRDEIARGLIEHLRYILTATKRYSPDSTYSLKMQHLSACLSVCVRYFRRFLLFLFFTLIICVICCVFFVLFCTRALRASAWLFVSPSSNKLWAAATRLWCVKKWSFLLLRQSTVFVSAHLLSQKSDDEKKTLSTHIWLAKAQ